jgi:drug/metabolite transporter (DMT)-like permease
VREEGDAMSRLHATLFGGLAVLLWASLALLTVRTAPMPPLLLNALAFGIAGAGGLLWAAAAGRLAELARVPLAAYAFSTAGLCGYHLLYFSALRLAPAAEAGLVAYLWPLLIVLLSGLLPGEHLRRGHLLGAALAFAGTAVLALGSRAADGDGSRSLGLLLALGCALTWAVYSVGSRRLGAVPTVAVAVACAATAALSFLAHLLVETPAWPSGAQGWAAVLLLGLGPVGAAFFLWDVGVKRGDIQLLGTLSYVAPVLSTSLLVLAGEADPSWRLAAAALCVAGGAALAARA